MTDFAARRDEAIKRARERYPNNGDARISTLYGAFQEILNDAIAEIARLEKILDVEDRYRIYVPVSEHQDDCECGYCQYAPEQENQAEELRGLKP